MKHWKPADVIALVIVTGSVVMLCMGINGTVSKTLIALTCLYYGIDLTPFIKLGRNIKTKDKGE